MVGKFSGWLIYLLALLNWVSMFQNSMGDSNMISITLVNHIFLVGLVCNMYEMSVMLNADNAISRSSF